MKNKNANIQALRILFSILTMALLIRIGIAFLTIDHSEPVGDIQYDMYAINILDVKGFRIDNLLSAKGTETPGSFGLDTLYSFKPPLYPLFLAAIYATLGRNFLVVGIIQAFLGTLTCLIVFRIGKIIFDEKIGLISALMLALYPYGIFQGIRITDTTLFVFLTTLSILYLYKITQKPTIRNNIISGITIGLAVLCRPSIVPFIPFIALWLGISFFHNKTRTLKTIAIVFAFVILTVLPWTIRNYLVLGQPVLFGTNGGYTFWQANNQFTEKYIRMRSDLDPIAFNEGINWREKGIHGLSEVEQDRWFYREGIKFIYDHPFDFIKLSGLKFLSLWNWYLYPSSESKLKNAFYTFSYGPMLILAIVGMMLTYDRWKKTLLLLFLFFSFTILYVIFYGKTIYRFPLDPFLFIFSAYTLLEMWSKIKKTTLLANCTP